MPSVFISYSWEKESSSHKMWVRELASSLRRDGITVILDQWDLRYGDPISEFIERGVRDSDYVLIICTPAYKIKADNRLGGVGYEGSIITAEVMHKYNHRKYIPVLRDGDWEGSAPTWLLGKSYVNLTGDPYSEENYVHLLAVIHNIGVQPPPVGPVPIEKIRCAMEGSQKSPGSGREEHLHASIVESVPNPRRRKIDTVSDIMSEIVDAQTVAECKVLDYLLSRHTSAPDRQMIRQYLFSGSQRQRNYAALYFKRLGDSALLEKAYREGKIDKVQAYSK